MRRDVLGEALRALDVVQDLSPRHAREDVAREQREQLVAPYDAAGAGDGADAVGVAVEADAEIGAGLADFVLEVTAGFNKGPFSIRVAPDVGPARDVKVIVK